MDRHWPNSAPCIPCEFCTNTSMLFCVLFKLMSWASFLIKSPYLPLMIVNAWIRFSYFFHAFQIHCKIKKAKFLLIKLASCGRRYTPSPQGILAVSVLGRQSQVPSVFKIYQSAQTWDKFATRGGGVNPVGPNSQLLPKIIYEGSPNNGKSNDAAWEVDKWVCKKTKYI